MTASGSGQGSSGLLEDTIVEEDIHPVYVSAGATDVGRLRSSNQDAFAELGEAGLWIVADGMGGYRDGDVASRMVCEAVQSLPAGNSLEATIDEIRQRMSDVNQVRPNFAKRLECAELAPAFESHARAPASRTHSKRCAPPPP